MSRLLIVQASDVPFAEIAKLTVPTVQAYAAYHGYDHLHFQGVFNPQLRPYWSKVGLTARLLYEYEFVWLLDVDVVIRDREPDILELISQEHVLNGCSADKDSVQPYWNMNSGSLVWKNSGMGHILLRKMYSGQYGYGHNSPGLDQGQLQSMLRAVDCTKYVKIHPANLFNHTGTFVYHYCCEPDISKKLQLIRNDLQGSTDVHATTTTGSNLRRTGSPGDLHPTSPSGINRDP